MQENKTEFNFQKVFFCNFEHGFAHSTLDILNKVITENEVSELIKVKKRRLEHQLNLQTRNRTP